MRQIRCRFKEGKQEPALQLLIAMPQRLLQFSVRCEEGERQLPVFAVTIGDCSGQETRRIHCHFKERRQEPALRSLVKKSGGEKVARTGYVTPIEYISTYIAGVTVDMNRQNLLRIARPPEAILLKREPGNPYDRNAITVCSLNGIQIGYLPRSLASRVVRDLAENFKFGGYLRRVESDGGFLYGDLILGCARPDVTDSELRDRLRGWMKEYR